MFVCVAASMSFTEALLNMVLAWCLIVPDISRTNVALTTRDEELNCVSANVFPSYTSHEGWQSVGTNMVVDLV